jgi:hypothetical protein
MIWIVTAVLVAVVIIVPFAIMRGRAPSAPRPVRRGNIRDASVSLTPPGRARFATEDDE